MYALWESLNVGWKTMVFLSIVAAVAMVFFGFLATTENKNTELLEVTNAVLDSRFSKYDATVVKGHDVIKAIESYSDMPIVVQNRNRFYYNRGVDIKRAPGIHIINGTRTELSRAIGNYKNQSLSTAKNYKRKADSGYIAAYTNYDAALIVEDDMKSVIGFYFKAQP